MHDFIFPYLPVLHGSHPLAGKPLVGSSYVYLGDYCARIMKFAKLGQFSLGAGKSRGKMWLNPAGKGW